jgi:hypothetical protein
MTLKRKPGLSVVLAVVMGDMIGSGIFFTPGECRRESNDRRLDIGRYHSARSH